MEIKISVVEFSRALSLMQGVAQRKNTMPILANVLLEAVYTSENTPVLVLSATDLEIGLRAYRKCEIVSEGAITLPARALLDIVKMLPGPDVVIKSLPNSFVSIDGSRTNAKLAALHAEEFPKLPSTEGVEFLQVDTSLFVDAVQKTIYSTSSDENRHNLSGVYFEPDAKELDSLTLVSTDGHRLSRVKRRFSGSKNKVERPLIMPRKGLSEAVRLLESTESSINPQFRLGFLDNQAIIRSENTILTMRLIDGAYPDYHQVIPKLSDKILRTSRTDFLMGVKRVSVLAVDRNQTIKLSAGSGRLNISCIDVDAGEILDSMPVEYSGPDIEIGLNARYVVEALSSLEGEHVIMKITDALSPILLTGTQNDQHECVIMPMRLQGANG